MKKIVATLLLICMVVSLNTPAYAVLQEEEIHPYEATVAQNEGEVVSSNVWVLDIYCHNAGCDGIGYVIDTFYDVGTGCVVVTLQCDTCGSVWFDMQYAAIAGINIEQEG